MNISCMRQKVGLQYQLNYVFSGLIVVFRINTDMFC